MAIVSSQVEGESRRVLKLTLNAGDVAYNPRHDPPQSLGNRTELTHLPTLSEGDDRWYRWRVYFPKNFAVTDGKRGGAVFAQWHHWSLDGEPGSPPLLLTAETNAIRVVAVPTLNSSAAETVALIPQRKGRWREFVAHVVFSSDPKKGLFEMWCDADQAVSKHLATLFPGYDAYLKMGLYRRPTARENNEIYLDDVIEATSRDDVWRTASVERPPR
jgi:hypothetical protein